MLLIDIMRPLLKFTGLTAETSLSSLSCVTFLTGPDRVIDYDAGINTATPC